jgi:hypothetical protein
MKLRRGPHLSLSHEHIYEKLLDEFSDDTYVVKTYACATCGRPRTFVISHRELAARVRKSPE